jgi:hypothetical protein
MYGQIRIEFIFGTIIFATIIFFIITQFNTVISTTLSDTRINNLKAKANNAIEVLTNDNGNPDNWFNFLTQGWQKRREIKITPSSKELINQQVSINVTWYPGMNPDFSDLRFTDSDKVINIPYWIENKTSKWALVWVKIPKISNLVNKSIYMYYGYPSATSESNGNNVFIQFLDLSGTSLPSGWVKKDIGNTIGNVIVSGGILRINNTGGNVYGNEEYNTTHVYKDSTVSTDFVAVTKVIGQKDTEEYAKAGITVQNHVEARKNNGMAFETATPYHYAFFWLDDPYNIAPYQFTETPKAPSKYPVYLKLIKSGSSVSGWYSFNGFDWNFQDSRIPYAISRDFQYVTLFMAPHEHVIGEANFSMFYVYQYASPEPKWTVMNEETKTNYSWFPIRTIGLAEKPYSLLKSKITTLNENCNLLSDFGLNDYRLKIYNSTNMILFCGTETLKPATITVYRSIFVDNGFGNITLELW